MARMDDEEFLNYVLLHSKSERHAFSYEDAQRLLDLAGVEKIKADRCGIPGFVGIGEIEADRLVGLARKRGD